MAEDGARLSARGEEYRTALWRTTLQRGQPSFADKMGNAENKKEQKKQSGTMPTRGSKGAEERVARGNLLPTPREGWDWEEGEGKGVLFPSPARL